MDKKASGQMQAVTNSQVRYYAEELSVEEKVEAIKR
jgi:hypothetical protein